MLFFLNVKSESEDYIKRFCCLIELIIYFKQASKLTFGIIQSRSRLKMIHYSENYHHLSLCFLGLLSKKDQKNELIYLIFGMYLGYQITGNPFFRYIWTGVGLSHKKVYKSIFSDTDTFETGTPIASSHSHILIWGKWLYHF